MAINVLVVDDSAFMRKMVSEMIESDPRLKVVGTARDGLDALEKVRTLPVDVITLDVNMPRMDGLAFLEVLMAENPKPVVMLSSLTQEGSETALEALALGAVDFVAKPSGAISLDIEKVKEELLRKVRTAARARLSASLALRRRRAGRERLGKDGPGRDWAEGRRFEGSRFEGGLPGRGRLDGGRLEGDQQGDQPTGTGGTGAGRRTAPRTPGPFRPFRFFRGEPPAKLPLGDTPNVLVAIGASTGGPTAVEEVLRGLPTHLRGVGIVITQHMQPGFTRSYAERLNARTAFTVREAVDGEPLREGLALVAPGDYHMVITPNRRVRLNQDPPVHYVRPAADVMMMSAAAAYGRNIVGVILTGMGRDGSGGMAAIKQVGGRTLVQDEETSVIFSMPAAVIANGHADEVLPLGQIAERIAYHCMELSKTA